jgi:hypothetical protein
MSLYTVVIHLAVEYCTVVVGSIVGNAACTIVDIGASRGRVWVTTLIQTGFHCFPGVLVISPNSAWVHKSEQSDLQRDAHLTGTAHTITVNILIESN